MMRSTVMQNSLFFPSNGPRQSPVFIAHKRMSRLSWVNVAGRLSQVFLL